MKQMGTLFTNLSTKCLVAAVCVGSVAAQVEAQEFNDTGDILARSAQVEDIEYKIMVQRATQTAIWAETTTTLCILINRSTPNTGF